MNTRNTVHYFETSGDAYDACMTGEHYQTGDEVRTGDVLVILEERVVGLCDTWPVAITKNPGKLHELKSEFTAEDYFADREGFPMQQIDVAQQLAVNI